MSLIEELKIKPKPDFDGRLKRVLLRKGLPDRVPFYELFADKPIKDKILGKPTLPSSLFPLPEIEELIKNEIEFWFRLGYDYVPLSPAFSFGMKVRVAQDTAEINMGPRFWVNEMDTRMIKTREDFEKFSWQDPDLVSLAIFDQVGESLPEGMKVIAQSPGGILENTLWLLGHEGIAYIAQDDPELLGMIFDKVGSTIVRLVERMVSREFVGAFQMGDDMGYKTSTMLSPSMLRKYVFPWQKKAVEISHKYEKPFILHSCGNLERIMDDLIGLGIDAKHSFEDEVTPLIKAKKLWGKKIAILGGIDMNFLALARVEEVKEYTKKIIYECAVDGGYALGTGNTVANYLKPENYLAMLETGYELGSYPIRI